jgi:hypothetical protein
MITILGIVLGAVWEVLSYNDFQIPRAGVELLQSFS